MSDSFIYLVQCVRSFHISKGFLSPSSQILNLCERACCFVVAGGHSEDHEDAQEDHQRSAADGAGGDPEEHVPALQEADQGAN